MKSVPLGDKESKKWIENRNADKHLELDFLPRHLVYNYGDELLESNKMMEKVLKGIGQDVPLNHAKS